MGKPIFLVNGWDQFSTAALEFHLAVKEWPAWEKPRVADVYLLRQPDNEAALPRFVEAVQAHETSVIVHLGNAPVPEAGAWDAYQAAIAGCWQGDASEQAGYWLHIWDGRVETETLARPFLYAGDSQSVREQYWYNLLLEITATPCQWP